MTGNIIIANNPERNRYEAQIDGRVVGKAEYQLTSQLIVFTHTEVDQSHEGQGIGSALAKFALTDVQSEGTREVLPLCSFIKAWIARHPEFIPLVFGQPSSTAKD